MSDHEHSHSHGAGGLPSGGHEEGHEGAPEWLISFADNTALLMGFFVILVALNMGPKGSAQQTTPLNGPPDAPINEADVAIAIRQAFNNPVDANSSDPREMELVRRLQELQGETDLADSGVRGKRRRVQSIGKNDRFSICGSVAFSAGSSTLSDEAQASITQIDKLARGVRYIIDVRGHVSSAEGFETNDHGMRLSFERALAVGSELVSRGYEWRQIRLHACGQNEPIDGPVYDWEGHRKNQRVDVVLSEVLPASQAGTTGDEDAP